MNKLNCIDISHSPDATWQSFATAVSGKATKQWRPVSSSKHAIVAYNPQKKQHIKAFLPRSKLDKAKALLFGSRCTRAVKQSYLLSSNNFLTPSILFWGKYQHREFIVLESFPGVGLGDYLASYLRNAKARRLIDRKNTLFLQLGSTIGQLHARGIIHGDLRPNNILVPSRSKDIQFCFIDNERNRLYRTPPKKAIIKNLVQINMLFPADMSLTYRARFFSSYFKAFGPKDRAQQKQLVKAVAYKVNDRLANKSIDHIVDSHLPDRLSEVSFLSSLRTSGRA